MSTICGGTVSANQPRKRARTEETLVLEQSANSMSATTSHVAATRGTIACEKCRSRKTRCDGQRPSCGFCSRKDIPCVYPDDAQGQHPWTTLGIQILDAVNSLRDLVTQHHHQRVLHDSGRSIEYAPDTAHPSQPSPDAPWSGRIIDVADVAHRFECTTPSIRSLETPSHPQGIESILAWKTLLHLSSPGCLFASDEFSVSSTLPIPNLSVNELCRLETKYINGIHSKNPVLDLAALHDCILHVAETGLDWSMKTCLVTLVCAIGAVTQQYQDYHISPNAQNTPGAPYSHSDGPQSSDGSELELSAQFWTLAAKRLGLAVGQIDLVATQCLCLAGIWYMHQMEPLRAWHFFNLASSAWYSINLLEQTLNLGPSLADQASHPSSPSPILQALFFTTWKSVCEIRLEISVPGSFDNAWLPYDFPLAPDENVPDFGTDAESKRRIWYYYLAEIAARHQINRIVNNLIWTNDLPTMKDVNRMLTLAETLEGHTEAWRVSLPPILQFDIPEGYSLLPHPDDMIQILRSRYLTCRELVGRYFARLYIDTDLPYDSTICARIMSFASQCLQYCMLKLSQVAPHRHQGTWFGLRNATAATLILFAAHLKQRNAVSTSSHSLSLPDGWQARVRETSDVLQPFWADSRGGASNIGILIRTILAECGSEHDIPGLEETRG